MPAWEVPISMKTGKKRGKSILLIGSGAREHAIAAALQRSPSAPVLHCLGSNRNPGIKAICMQTGGLYRVGKITSPEEAMRFSTETGADLAIIGPEAPLAAGVADAIRNTDVAVFGPNRELAQIETSKAYARELLLDTIPESCPEYRIVSTMDEAGEFLHKLGEFYVIKADGLTGGKGVKVAGDHLNSHEEALDYCRSLLQAAEGATCLIEQKLEGEEFSLMTITDGCNAVHLPAVQDHKRAYDGDTGPNTGGMGSYSDADHALPFLTSKDITEACRMNEAVISALGKRHGTPYRGVLYGGFMAVSDGIRIIEYNARFGDPEALNLLTLLEGDAAELFAAAAEGTLEPKQVSFADRASVCKYVVPEGYPVNAVVGTEVSIEHVPESVHLYLGSVEAVDGRLLTGGSRTAAVTALGKTIAEAEELAEAAVSRIEGKVFHRRDIGTAAVIARRLAHMNEVRKR